MFYPIKIVLFQALYQTISPTNKRSGAPFRKFLRVTLLTILEAPSNLLTHQPNVILRIQLPSENFSEFLVREVAPATLVVLNIKGINHIYWKNSLLSGFLAPSEDSEKTAADEIKVRIIINRIKSFNHRGKKIVLSNE